MSENTVAEQNKSNIFDILRAIAIFIVFVCHNLSISYDFYPQYINKFPTFFHLPAWRGVWIFFILSGYLIGKGFYNNKYQTDWKGIFNFVVRRFLRIAPMYYLFLLIIFLFVNPVPFFDKSIFSLIFFVNNYFPGGSIQTGLLWFVSTIFQLYILSPIIYKFVLSFIKSKYLFFLALIVIGGLALRMTQCYWGYDWYKVTYVNTLSNLDLFFGGFLLNQLVNHKDKVLNHKKFLSFCKVFSFIMLFVLVGVNVFVYCTAESSSIHSRLCLNLYRYIFPSLYLVVTLFVIWAFDSKERVKYAPLTFANMVKNPIRFVEGFGVISFVFYVFHATILQNFAKYFMTCQPIDISLFNIIRIHMGTASIVVWGVFIFSFVFSVLWSVIVYNCIEKPASGLKNIKLLNGEK